MIHICYSFPWLGVILNQKTTSQDTESNPSTEGRKENTTDADNDNGSTKEVQSSDKPSKKTNISGPMVKVSIELVNGVTIEGDASVNTLIVWDKGMDIDINVNGEILHIGGERINSVSQMSVKETQPKPQEIQINVNSTSDKDEDLYTLEPSAKGFSYHNPSCIKILVCSIVDLNEKGRQLSISKSLLFTSGAVAVTDNVTILGGTVTLNPFLLSIVGGKYSYEYSPTLRFFLSVVKPSLALGEHSNPLPMLRMSVLHMVMKTQMLVSTLEQVRFGTSRFSNKSVCIASLL